MPLYTASTRGIVDARGNDLRAKLPCRLDIGIGFNMLTAGIWGAGVGIRSNASIALIACALLFSPAAAVEAEPAGQAGGKKLLFLGNRALPPMVYLERGKNQGIVIDLVNALAVEMGASVDIHLMDWAAAQRLVALGSADALIQINKTEARLLVYDFSGPLLESRFMIFARGMEKSIHGAADLRGLKVGVEAKGFPQLALQGDSLVRLVTIPTVLEGF